MVGLSCSDGLADSDEETALTAADFGGGCSGEPRDGKVAALEI